MASIGDVSVSHIASSLAQNIVASDPATEGIVGAKPVVSIATAMKGAFDGLMQSQQDTSVVPSKDSPIAPITPFSTPSVSGDGLMSALKEAVGAFNELSGMKQDVSQQFAQFSGAQHASDVGDQQFAQLSDKQHVSNLGDQQLAQFSDKQHVSNLGGQQIAQLSNKQQVSNLGDQQLAQFSDKQHVSNLGNQQLAQLSDKQHTSSVGDKQFSQPMQADRSSSGNQGAKMLDQCTNFFTLLQKLVTGDQDLAAKARGVLR
jgi:hypothetical protein